MNKLFNNKIFLALMLIPFMRPAIYIIGPVINKFLNYLVLFEFILLFTMYVKNGKISKLFISFLTFEFIICISTFINGNYNNISKCIIDLCSLLDLCMIFELGLKINKSKIIKTSFYYYGLLLLINSITFYIFYPNGMDQGIYMDALGDKNFYFLGQDNGTIFYAIMVILLGIIHCINKYDRITILMKIYSIFIVFSYMHVNSGNGFAIGSIIILYEFLYKYINKFKFINIKNMTIIYIIFYFLIVIFRSNLNVITLVLDLLGKDYTFTGRTIIWDKALKYIKLKPLLGYGFEDSLVIMGKFRFVKLHNMILQFIYNGGFMAFINFMYIYFICTKNLKLNKSGKYTNILVIFSTIFLIASTFDFYISRSLLYLIFILMFNINKLENVD